MTRRRNWNIVRPNSLRHAMELSLEFARERHNRSVERVADSMGAASHWVVYKWMESARLPAVLIRPFERACGIDFVTRYLAASGHRLVIDIPTGRKATGQEIQALQEGLTAAVGLLLRFYDGRADRGETAAAVLESIEALAWHHGNVQRHDEPELDFNGGASQVTAATRVTGLNKTKGDHRRKWTPHEKS